MGKKRQVYDDNEVEQVEVAVPVSVIDSAIPAINGQVSDIDDPTAMRQDTTEISIARSSFPCSRKQFGFDDVQIILSIIYEEPQPVNS
jgi:hypothetical protein